MALYPKGRIAMGNGDLADVTDVQIKTTNGGKQVHTLRKRGAGTTLGKEETSVTFKSAVTEDGPERDYWKMCQKGQVKTLRIKLPAKTLTVEGIYTEVDGELPIDDAVHVNCTFVGKLQT